MTVNFGALRGMRVFELTTAWAGPFAGRHLAALGAEVIKVESPRRIDNWRGFIRTERLPNREAGERPYNRTAFFNTQNMGKRSIALDLAHPDGREVALQLIAVSDLVLANFAGGALERMGLGRDDLRKRNPNLSVVEMPAFRSDSTRGHYIGMGQTMEAAAGMTGLIGYGDGVPVSSGPAVVDPVGGLHGAAASLASLWATRHTGQGSFIELAQVDAATRWIAEYIDLYGRSGKEFVPDGNRLPTAGPHDAFPCKGEDQWIAIAASEDRDWQTLIRLMSRTDLENDERFQSGRKRADHHQELSTEIAAWTSQFGKFELAELLQKSGVPAAPVKDGRDLVEDGALEEVGFVREVDHPEAGTHKYQGLGLQLSDTPLDVHRAAPLFGEATDYVLGELLGYSVEQIEALIDAGAVSRQPHVTRANDS